jgi:alpha-glucosidase
MTVNGTWTCDLSQMGDPIVPRTTRIRSPKFNLNEPPYAIHNGQPAYFFHCACSYSNRLLMVNVGYERLSTRTIATNATHAGGEVELDVHNMWGLMEEKATHAAMHSIRPGKRPFLISRSTFPSSGKWSGHWLGDNVSCRTRFS